MADGELSVVSSRPRCRVLVLCPRAPVLSLLFVRRVTRRPDPVYTLLLPAGPWARAAPVHVYPINILVVLSAHRVRIVRFSAALRSLHVSFPPGHGLGRTRQRVPQQQRLSSLPSPLSPPLLMFDYPQEVRTPRDTHRHTGIRHGHRPTPTRTHAHIYLRYRYIHRRPAVQPRAPSPKGRAWGALRGPAAKAHARGTSGRK